MNRSGVCKSSLSEARAKLSYKAFEFLLTKANLETRGYVERWKGHIVRAIDGTKITLPNTKEILESFPQRNNACGRKEHYPLANLLTAVNVFTAQSVCAAVTNKSGSERSELLKMLKNFQEGDIALLDRGLDGASIYKTFDKLKQFYIGRQRASKGELKEFIKSGKKDVILDRTVKHQGEIYKFKMRLIRGRVLRTGKPVVIGTNLLDQKKYSRNEILSLYRMRWKVETLYYRVKAQLRVCEIKSKTVNGVLQDIFAHLLVLSLTTLAVKEAKRNYPSKVKEPNFKNAIQVMKRHLQHIVGNRKTRMEAHTQGRLIIQQISAILFKPQKNRSYPRYSRKPINPWTYGKLDKIKRFEKTGRWKTT